MPSAVDQPQGGETPAEASEAETLMDEEEVHLVSEADQELLEHIRLNQLMVDDPLAYEQEMIDQRLNEK